MLAKQRQIIVNGKTIPTPILIPSFSSKVDIDLQQIFENSSEYITDTYLVSAYDLKYNYIKPETLYAPELLFIDSGGYEVLPEKYTPTELLKKNPQIKEWTRELFEETIESLNYQDSYVLICYDHPEDRSSLEQQIQNAKDLFKRHPKAVKEFLIKPESKKEEYLNTDHICSNINRLSEFDIIGLTDKELGDTLINRMDTIARIRKALQASNQGSKPIHIFGSLDTVTSPLYFLAGADIFDGLTWLKFSFCNGHTVYQQTAGALRNRANIKTYQVDDSNYYDNFLELSCIRGEMKRFIGSNDFSSFETHGDLFKKYLQEID